MSRPPAVRPFLRTLLLLPALLQPGGCHSHDSSGEDHAHGAGDHAHESGPGEIAPAVVTLFGERVLLFMEHPRLVAGESARFLAHFSVLATGEPVRSGHVELTLGDTRLVAEAPARDGLFTPEGRFPAAGSFPARLVLSSEQASETLELGAVVVHASAGEARASAAADAGSGSAAGVPFLMEQQWKIGLLLAQAGPDRLVERLVVQATVVAAEGASAIVAAPAAGRLLPPEGGSLPASGARVEAGAGLALLEPPLSSADAAQLRALDLQWSLEALDVESRRAEATARVQFAAREHERLAGLRPAGLATQQDLDAAERDLALARVGLAASEAASAALDELAGRRARDAWSSDGTLRLRLLSPIAGEVVASGRVSGEALDAGDEVFRVVDRSRLWIEGRLREFDLAQLTGARGAQATFPALPGLRIELVAPEGGELFLADPALDDATRTLRLRAALPAPPAGLRAGMLAELHIAVAAVDAPVVIPAGAIVPDQGLPTAWVLLDGETFQRRELVLGLRDGGLVEVRSGVAAGEHVASHGAAIIRLAALAPSDFGHGHAH